MWMIVAVMAELSGADVRSLMNDRSIFRVSMGALSAC